MLPTIIATILSSSLASWFFLMTASAFGLWKRRLLLRDIEHLPTPDLEEALRSKAGRHLTRLAQKLQRRTPNDDDWQMIDEAVFDLYDLDETDRIVARDGLFRASWQWHPGRDRVRSGGGHGLAPDGICPRVSGGGGCMAHRVESTPYASRSLRSSQARTAPGRSFRSRRSLWSLRGGSL